MAGRKSSRWPINRMDLSQTLGKKTGLSNRFPDYGSREEPEDKIA
jgi:hypothetical protein